MADLNNEDRSGFQTLDGIYDFDDQADYDAESFLSMIGKSGSVVSADSPIEGRGDENGKDRPSDVPGDVRVGSGAVQTGDVRDGSRREESGTVRTCLYLSRSSYESLVVLSVFRNMSVSGMVREILMNYLDGGCRELPRRKRGGDDVKVNISIGREEYLRFRLRGVKATKGAVVQDALQGELAGEVKRYRKRRSRVMGGR